MLGLDELEIALMFTALDKRSVRASLGCSGLADFSEGRKIGSFFALQSTPSTVWGVSRIAATGGEDGGDANFFGGTLLVKGRLMSENFSVETEDGDVESLVPDNNVGPCVKAEVFFSAAVNNGLEPVSSLISISGFARPTVPERAERVVTFPVDRA
jgi:hypothetical protein